MRERLLDCQSAPCVIRPTDLRVEIECKRIVIHVWDNVDQVKAWWDSAQSKALRKIGAQDGKLRIFAVESLPND